MLLRDCRPSFLCWRGDTLSTKHSSAQADSVESELPNAAQLVAQLREGDSIAAFELHQQFREQLLGVVQARMHPLLQRRMGADDVLQSAFCSFFRVVSAEDWNPLGSVERIWNLLLAIALNKLNARTRFHLAEKRSVTSEQHTANMLTELNEPDAVCSFIDEVEWVLRESTPLHRKILEAVLSGQNEKAIAEDNQCSLRTVYRAIERVVEQLQSRLD
jgi:eukaryotic-like serine/threonine-protein kinase